MNLKKRLAHRLLWGVSNGPSAARRLNLLNRVKDRQLNVDWHNDSQLFKVTQSGEHPVYIARLARIKSKYMTTTSRSNQIVRRYLLDQVRFEKGDVLIDVGANIGELSMALAHKFGVFPVAVEPDPTEIKCLNKNLELFPSLVYSGIAWHEDCSVTISCSNDTGDTSIALDSADANCIRSKAHKLDSLFGEIRKRSGKSHIKCVKVEAEGWEPEVLAGAFKLLQATEYVTADLGPERGSEKSNTVAMCSNILFEQGFDMVDANPRESTFLFRSRRLFD